MATNTERRKYIDVLVDGKFKKELRDEELYFRGSRNQRMIDVQTSLQKGETVIYHYNPVSYTHLDVYKRQYLLAVAAVFTACNSGNNGYTVTGTVEGAADGDTVYLETLAFFSYPSSVKDNKNTFLTIVITLSSI